MTVMSVWRSANDTGLTVTSLENQAGLHLRGEADMLSVDALRAAIAALPGDLGEVRLELAELNFIDVCCTRELVALARRPARPRLLLHRPPPSLTRLMRLLWPDRGQMLAPAAVTPAGFPGRAAPGGAPSGEAAGW